MSKKKNWGGAWTLKKLEAFSKYVSAYLTIMKEYEYWELIYFDGFSGSGDTSSDDNPLMDSLELALEESRVYEGAAERVLKLPGKKFDYYYFVDENRQASNSLSKKLKNLPEANNKRLVFRASNANEELKKLAEAMHRDKKFAALVFLDPFGMQIEWDAIASLKDTRSDVWILVPTGVIINRLLDRKGQMKSYKLLERFFGLKKEEIKEHFYKTRKEKTLFGEKESVKKLPKAIEKIATLYIKRLKTIWSFVSESPLPLENSRGVPIFHFVFASNNSNALKIARDIIKKT